MSEGGREKGGGREHREARKREIVKVMEVGSTSDLLRLRICGRGRRGWA